MKQHTALVIIALLIMVLAMSLMMPIRAAAQPGNVTIRGQVIYQPRNWNPQISNWGIGREIRIDLYEKDLNGNDHFLDTTYTDSAGNFVFPSRTNWWQPDNRQLNIFLVLVTAYPQTAVTDRLFRNYAFASLTTFLFSDGTWTINFPLTNSWNGYQALWIFEDLRNAWNYVHIYDAPYDPGSVTAVWETNLNCYPLQFPDWLNVPCGSFTYGGIITHFIFISYDNNNSSMDTVVHETGHMYMVNANGWWYTGCPTHYMFSTSNVNCAWSEGWADFFPLTVNGDQCYNFRVNPCDGIADQDYFNLEVHSRSDNQYQFAWGDGVEGRVAAALYDLYDSNSEGFDRISAGFSPIAHIALGSSQITTSQNFWNNWKNGSGQNSFLSGLTLWWNTINYMNIRQNYLPTINK